MGSRFLAGPEGRLQPAVEGRRSASEGRRALPIGGRGAPPHSSLGVGV